MSEATKETLMYIALHPGWSIIAMGLGMMYAQTDRGQATARKFENLVRRIKKHIQK